MVVTRGDPPANVNVGDGGAVLEGDVINGALGASGEVCYVDTQTSDIEGTVVSFDSAEPTTIDINWEYVNQVDEYYAGSGYEYVIITTDDEQFKIQG